MSGPPPEEGAGATRAPEIRVLGDFAARVGAADVRVAARKQRALVALLALRPRTRDELVAALWPESDQERGRESLRQALSRLRSILGAEVFAVEGERVGLGPGVSVDARDLQRLAERDDQRVLALYRGDLCAELDGEDAEAERARLRGIAAAAGERLARELLERDPERALAAARRVAEIDPYREAAHRLVMSALVATGDVAGAAAHHRRLVAVLRDDLGVDPSAETRALYDQIVRPDRAVATPRVRRPSPEPPAELVGRRAEYARAVERVTDAIDGRGATTLIVGEPGSGKSRLLDEVAAVSERHGLRVLRGRADPGGSLPFQLWVDALRGCVSDASSLPAPWPSILSALIPESGGTGTFEPPRQLDRTRLFEGVVRLLMRVADTRPAVLTLDDLHHADGDSLSLVRYASRATAGGRVAIVTAIRPHSRGALDAAIGSLRARPGLVEIPLPPLTPDAVNELLVRSGLVTTDARWLGPRVARWTGGNPLFALEALRALAATGRLGRSDEGWHWNGPTPDTSEPLAAELPTDVRQTIIGRLGVLADATRRLVDLAAVAGDAVRIDLLGIVSGRDELLIAEDLGPALDAAFLRDAGGPAGASIAFAHDLVREAVYQHVPALVRAAMHRRVADGLERLGASSSLIGAHLLAAGEASRAMDHLLAAARDAAARYAHDESARVLREALGAVGPSGPRRAEILALVGDAEMRRGATAAAVAAYDEALATLPATDPDTRASLAVRIAGACRHYERHPRALELATEAVGHVRARGSERELPAALIALAWVRYGDDDAASALAAAEEARAIAQRLQLHRAEAEALQLITWSRWLSGDALAGIAVHDLERLAALLGDDELVAALYDAAAVARGRAADVHGALDLARRSLEIARRIGSPLAELGASQQAAEALLALGRYAEAAALCGEIRDGVVVRLGRAEPVAIEALLAEALAASGGEERAGALCDELLAAAARRTQAPLHADYALAAINVALTLGRTCGSELIESQRPSCRTCVPSWLFTAGRHAALTGDGRRALGLAERLSADAATPPGMAALAQHVRALGLLAAGEPADGSADAARRALAERNRLDWVHRFEVDLGRVSRQASEPG